MADSAILSAKRFAIDNKNSILSFKISLEQTTVTTNNNDPNEAASLEEMLFHRFLKGLISGGNNKNIGVFRFTNSEGYKNAIKVGPMIQMPGQKLSQLFNKEGENQHT